ncbi:hypothetical protein ABW20_dc0101483 [Dactylellina cionopaga]|nr:hypothetical protein ABW20_dc0101483 [Dactylellina cionopaga]
MDTNSSSPEKGHAPGVCKLLSLPSEIIHQILLNLPEISLYAISLTCKRLQTHSFTDSLWETIVNSPDLTSPHPYLSYRALHHALSPHLYLNRKIFIGDRKFFGSILISKYMPMSGTLEAFSLTVTPPTQGEFAFWSYNPEVVIYPFDPKINIREEPELKISPNSKASEDGEIPVSRRGILATYFRAEAILQRDVYPQMAVWPSRIIPCESRVRNESANGFRGSSVSKQRGPFMRLPSNVSINGTHVSVGGFHTNDVVGAAMDRSAFIPPPVKVKEVKDADDKWRVDGTINKSGALSEKAFRLRRWAVLGDASGDIEGRFRMGEKVETFSELDEELWTPTREYPYRGIWIGMYNLPVSTKPEKSPFSNMPISGNYTPHSPEFLLFHQPTTTSSQKRLEVIKLTGDPNVPRGEYTWIIDDLSQPTRTADEEEVEWPGAKIYKARGHIADDEFRDDRYIDVQVILPSAERDWQDQMDAKRKPKNSDPAAANDVERANEIGEGWGVGGEERGNAGTSKKLKEGKRSRKNFFDEPWVPKRAFLYWQDLGEFIMGYERVDVEKFLAASQ